MRHRNAKKTLGRTAAPRRAMVRNLVTSIILHGRVRTTLVKSRVVRPRVERLVTIAKKGDLTSRRRLHQYLFSEPAVKKLMESIAPAMKGRKGGYTRALKLGRRQGDGAPLVVIEFVQ